MSSARIEFGLGIVAIVAAVIGGFAFFSRPHSGPAPTPTVVASLVPSARPTLQTSNCHYRTARDGQTLPDPACTPGALNPNVSQNNITATICRQGWTATIRPPLSFTEPLKRRQMVAYGQDVSKIAQYELDHLVSLELGGAPADPSNTWPEPGASPNSKDGIENRLRRAVCEGTISLAEAQRRIASDWTIALP